MKRRKNIPSECFAWFLFDCRKRFSLRLVHFSFFFHSQLAFLSFRIFFFPSTLNSFLLFSFILFSHHHFALFPPPNIYVHSAREPTLRMENKYEYKKKYTRRQTVCWARKNFYSRDSSSEKMKRKKKRRKNKDNFYFIFNFFSSKIFRKGEAFKSSRRPRARKPSEFEEKFYFFLVV